VNPGEYLNQDVETNAVGRQRAKTKGQLMRNLRGYLRSTQKCPDVVRRFFHAGPVRCAAADSVMYYTLGLISGERMPLV
jgi:hypothetical protein